MVALLPDRRVDRCDGPGVCSTTHDSRMVPPYALLAVTTSADGGAPSR